jgi:membrane-associated phospholipid phosphatase
MLFSSQEKINIKKIAGKISLSLVLLIVVFVLCLLCLFAVADMIFEDKNLFFDEHVFALIKPHINPVNTRIFNAVSFLGSFAFLLPANLLFVLYFLLVKKERHNAWKAALVSITSLLVLFMLKGLLQRQRPPAPLIAQLHDYSFPSGHTFSSVVFFGMLMYTIYQHCISNTVKWWLIIILCVLVLAIGFSRVYLRFHYASDVIAGFCLGVMWLVLARWILVKTDTAGN